MVNNDIRTILKNEESFEIKLISGCVPKCDFNGNLHVAPEQIERISQCFEVLFDKKWYTADGKALILKFDNIKFTKVKNNCEVGEVTNIKLYFSVKGTKNKFWFSEINGVTFEWYIRNKIFKDGMLTKERLKIIFKVLSEQPQYLMFSRDGKFLNFDFDTICSRVQSLTNEKE